MINNRLAAAGTFLDKYRIDSLLFLNLSNIRYLSGFTGSEGALVIYPDESCFLTDSRYTTQASAEVSDSRTVIFQEKGPSIAAELLGRGVKRVGFEAESMTVAFHNTLSGLMPGIELVPVGTDLNNLRIIKDPGEISLLGSAAKLASDALMQIIPMLRPGTVERDAALELEFAMLKAGADDKAFDIIIASGERGALPHGKASDKTICSGELVTIDFGLVYHGYNSDETVTVVVGTPDSEQRKIHQIVKDAHDLALEQVKPGISCRQLDALARNFIEEKGYGKYFGHGLGHGVGLDIHEKPVISPRSEAVVEEGMVFTIEPGIYVPGWGGVRIEDTVCVTGDGCSVLTKACKDLLVL